MDPYFKKDITYKVGKHNFIFSVGETLFSTFQLDHGTDVLIRAIEANSPQSILDLGCGYGPLGIILAHKFPKAQITMIDKDLLAVRYSKQNAIKNQIQNIKVLGSVGMEQVEGQTFDLIVSNVPAKIGDEAITQEFILTPYMHLNPGGSLWIVVVNALNRLIPKIGRQYDLPMKEIRNRHGHSVYRIKK